VTDARQEAITRRRVAAVAVTGIILAALIGLVQSLASPSRGDLAIHGGDAVRPRGTASSHVSRGARGRLSDGELRAGSDPNVLPGGVLIADRDNNRLLEVSPTGQMLWRFPESGELAPGQSFKLPDDAFFSPDGSQVVVTQEDDFVISVVDVMHPRIAYRYGHPGEPGSEPGYLHNPDDALLTPGGAILAADIKNCRLVVIRPPAHRVAHQLGETGNCTHELGVSYGSPNGAFPMTGGDTVVTEINGDWIDVLGHEGRPVTDTHPPGFSYPSDTNEVRPGVFLSVDYTNPGAIETFTTTGQLLWRLAAGLSGQPRWCGSGAAVFLDDALRALAARSLSYPIVGVSSKIEDRVPVALCPPARMMCSPTLATAASDNGSARAPAFWTRPLSGSIARIAAVWEPGAEPRPPIR
jgi:hypothetical protein